MTKVKVEKSYSYTAVNHEIYRNKTIPVHAMALHSFMYHLPPNWEYSIAGLSKCLLHGKDFIRTCLNVLEEEGYLIRHQTSFGKNKYLIFPESILKKQLTSSEIDHLMSKDAEIIMVEPSFNHPVLFSK